MYFSFNSSIKIFINDINLIFERKYFYSNNSIEIFTNKNKSYYFNFGIKEKINEEENNKNKFLKFTNQFAISKLLLF